MKNRTRRTPHADPTAERTADQSTQENSGLHGGLEGARPGPGPELAHESDPQFDANDVMSRSDGARYETPRRYERAETTRRSDESTDDRG
jgi:hypothetical protein